MKWIVSADGDFFNANNIRTICYEIESPKSIKIYANYVNKTIDPILGQLRGEVHLISLKSEAELTSFSDKLKSFLEDDYVLVLDLTDIFKKRKTT